MNYFIIYLHYGPFRPYLLSSVEFTELSKYVWNLKEKDIDHKINWSILKHTKSYSNASKRCQLCLWENFYIITSNKQTTLNSRTEL